MLNVVGTVLTLLPLFFFFGLLSVTYVLSSNLCICTFPHRKNGYCHMLCKQ